LYFRTIDPRITRTTDFFLITELVIALLFRDVAWAQREAYLELARREEGGLPLIDANLIESSRVALPSDEELGDFEIII